MREGRGAHGDCHVRGMARWRQGIETTLEQSEGVTLFQNADAAYLENAVSRYRQRCRLTHRPSAGRYQPLTSNEFTHRVAPGKSAKEVGAGLPATSAVHDFLYLQHQLSEILPFE